MNRSAATPALDPASLVTVKRFLLRLGLLATFALILNRQPATTFIGLIDLAAVLTCVCALFARDRPGRGPLNQWDEALALFGVRCLVLGARAFLGP
jgi:hypothetical protein